MTRHYWMSQRDSYVQQEIARWSARDAERAQQEADKLALEVARRRAKLEALLKQADKRGEQRYDAG